ncbi:MAG: hypothetical protein ACI9EF_003210, partial [Pseudohongiellaceae bacterium]
NAIDPASLTETSVSVSSQVPGFRVELNGKRLMLSGDFRGRGRFRVSLAGSLRDEHGQTLEGGRELTITVQPVRPSFAIEGAELQILDPLLAPALHLHAVNVDQVRLEVYRVRVDQWIQTRRFARAARRGEEVPVVGDLLSSVELDLEGALDENIFKTVGLSEFLGDRPGQLLVRSYWNDGDRDRMASVWLQRTQLGLHAAVDGEQLLVWATDLATGSPLQGVSVTIDVTGMGLWTDVSALTDSTGLAQLPLPEESPGDQRLLARLRNDVIMLPENRWTKGGSSSSRWVARDHGVTPLFYVFDDRGLYKPGESVRIKGWVREVEWRKGGDTRALSNPEGRAVGWRLRDARWVERASGSVKLDAFGGFEMNEQLPDDINLGNATFEFALDDAQLADGSHHGHTLQVQEFRLPEYEVVVDASPGSVVLGNDVELVVDAHYYTGGALPDAPLTWSLDAQATNYAPPGWPRFSFGKWVPWWGGSSHYGRGSSQQGGHWSWGGRTDSSGSHLLTAQLLECDPPQPMVLNVEAAVTDVNQQQWVGRSSVLVHPSEHALGLRTEQGFVELGDPLQVSFVVVDLDGQVVADRPVTLVATRTSQMFKEGRWVTEELARAELSAVSKDGPASLEVLLTEGGSWTLMASCSDRAGRPYVSSRNVWVSGGESLPSLELALEELTLVPDKADYQPGDTAQVLVVAPFVDGHGFYTLRREGVVHKGTFTMDGNNHTLRLPITGDQFPQIELSVELVGQAVRTDVDGQPRPDQPPRPAYATAITTLLVPPEARRLTVEATPLHSELSPGAENSVTVFVGDANGEPVPGAQVALVVVDEAVLAMTMRELADPLGHWHPQHPGRTSDYRARDMVHLGDPDTPVPQKFGELIDRRRKSTTGDEGDLGVNASRVAFSDEEMLGAMKSLGYLGSDAGGYEMAPAMSMKAMPGLAAGRGVSSPEPIAVRTNFDVLAAFVPASVTDENGQATVPFTLPDRLTRYRVLALAVEGDARAGKGEASLTARLPLMVRPSPPRFLNVGDTAELPVVVHNALDTEQLVDVGVQAAGLSLGGKAVAESDYVFAARRVLVPAHDRVEVRFPVTAELPGQAQLSVVATAVSSPELADGARVDFPVLTPLTAEAFATYGQLDDAICVQPLLPPTDVLPGFGGLELTFSTTALAELTDAVIQLSNGRYQSAETRASRVLTIAALGDVLAAFEGSDLPSPEALSLQAKEDIEHLSALQNSDGGWSFWRHDEKSQPYLSVHVAHALLQAGQHGFDVPSDVLGGAVQYVGEARRHVESQDPPMSPGIQRVIRAYALALRQGTGEDVADDAYELLRSASLDAWPLDGLGWLLPALASDPSLSDDVARVRGHLANRVIETASTAHFVQAYDQGGELVLAAPRRADAVVLSGLLACGFDTDLQPKLVRGLLSQRIKGRWLTSQESVFALLALSRYFALHEGDAPELTAALWAGERLVAEELFAGRSPERRNLSVPFDALETVRTVEADDATPIDLTMSAAGRGRLYWRMGVHYVPSDLSAEPLSAGFDVERTYEALDDPNDVTCNDDGTWIIRRGARVAVRLTLVNTSRRFHVALVDRLPGGFEVLNSAFAVTGAIPEDEEAVDPRAFWSCWFWGRPWYDHENLRDAQVEVFAQSLGPGVHRYSYVVRATTPGSFVVPSAEAEEIYAPETLGRSASTRVVVR